MSLQSKAHTRDIPESPHHLSHLYEGDIKLSEEQRLNNILFGNPDRAPSRAATNVDKIKWPNAVIPYEFDCSVGEYFKSCPASNSIRFFINVPLFIFTLETCAFLISCLTIGDLHYGILRFFRFLC